MGEPVNVLIEVCVQTGGPPQGCLILKQEAHQGQQSLLVLEGYNQLVQGGDGP